MEGGVVREEDDTHPSTAEWPLDLIGAQLDSWLQSAVKGF